MDAATNARRAHDPRAPRLQLAVPVSENMKPHILEMMLRCETFVTDRKKHRQFLNWVRRDRSRAKAFRQFEKRERRKRGAPVEMVPTRARRSDGLESFALCMKAMMYMTDIPSDRIGRWVFDGPRGRRGRFVGITATVRRDKKRGDKLGEIQRLTGLRRGTVDNAMRLIRDLKLIETHQPVEKKTDANGKVRVIGLPAVRRWTFRTWEQLSAKAEHKRHQDIVSDERSKERAAAVLEDEKQTREARELLERAGLAQPGGERRLKGRRAVDERERRDEAEQERRLAFIRVQADVYAEWERAGRAIDGDEIRAEAGRRLGIPPPSRT